MTTLQNLIAAAKTGNIPAKAQLANIYYNGHDSEGTQYPQNRERAVNLFYEAALAGDAQSMYNLGIASRDGQGGAFKSPETAYAWFKLAEIHGYAKAHDYAANLHLTNQQTKDAWGKLNHSPLFELSENGSKSLAEVKAQDAQVFVDNHQTLLDKAKTGDVAAELQVGVAYKEGSQGFHQDNFQSIVWLEKAAKGGSVDAIRIIGDGVDDRVGACAWFGVAKLYGDQASAQKLAALKPTHQEFIAAAKFIDVDPTLGPLYMAKTGHTAYVKPEVAKTTSAPAPVPAPVPAPAAVPVAVTAAAPTAAEVKIFNTVVQEAATGNAAAQFDTGHAYETGTGTAKDLTTAAAWYMIAAKNKEPNAKAFLDKLWPTLTPAQQTQAKQQADQWIASNPDAMLNPPAPQPAVAPQPAAAPGPAASPGAATTQSTTGAAAPGGAVGGHTGSSAAKNASLAIKIDAWQEALGVAQDKVTGVWDVSTDDKFRAKVKSDLGIELTKGDQDNYAKAAASLINHGLDVQSLQQHYLTPNATPAAAKPATAKTP